MCWISFCVIPQGSNNISFSNKSWVGTTLAWESKATRPRHANKVLCMSVQQASESKVAVKPLDLESANEPPLNTYKPKEPYTATIVSVERIVGPKAPGETCHIVIDHGGNVPYWEGQSYGIIPPVSNSCFQSFSLFKIEHYAYALSVSFIVYLSDWILNDCLVDTIN
jgi:sulfite reductase alpha subunit-like flavoprotein